jgi:hypothetical protein
MRNLLIETQTGKPAPSQMHAQFLDQLALIQAERGVGGYSLVVQNRALLPMTY